VRLKNVGNLPSWSDCLTDRTLEAFNPATLAYLGRQSRERWVTHPILVKSSRLVWPGPLAFSFSGPVSKRIYSGGVSPPPGQHEERREKVRTPPPDDRNMQLCDCTKPKLYVRPGNVENRKSIHIR
jgi:hypothetical protein